MGRMAYAAGVLRAAYVCCGGSSFIWSSVTNSFLRPPILPPLPTCGSVAVFYRVLVRMWASSSHESERDPRGRINWLAQYSVLAETCLSGAKGCKKSSVGPDPHPARVKLGSKGPQFIPEASLYWSIWLM